MGFDIGQLATIGANVGVIAGLIFLAMEIRQNNKFLAAQARYSLRQYRSDIADSLMLPHVLQATHKWARGEPITPEEKSTGLMVAIKIVELWEWQYGEYSAGLLKKQELPVGAWHLWFHNQGPFPVPIQEIYEMRKTVLNAEFVQFFDANVVARTPDNSSE
ncbi:MAG: hypothetical protein KJO72_08000 [Gammaproteobacteria bacterium]|nr:hypothetical protein [Gammaproteobacteria bacterium]MBT8056861.1 hypothetical protein [Gammaproteobacteria bacterium]NNJ79153.1 hypothetical protein [Xanthomonadales bacterium]